MTHSGESSLLITNSLLCKSIEDIKTGLQGGSRIQVSSLFIPKTEGVTDGRLIMPSPEKASKSRSLIGAVPTRARSNSQDRGQLSTETAIVHVTDADNLDDADAITECLTGVTLLKPDHINNSEQDQEDKEEQLEAFGAIRAVQKKLIKLADEATTAAVLVPDQIDNATGSNISPSSTSVRSSAILQQPEGITSQEIPNIVEPEKQTDEVAAEPTAEPEIVKRPESIERGNGMIQFTDSLGSCFEIPYDLIRTWQVSTAMLLAPLYAC